MESESERKGYPKRKSKKKQRIDRIPVPKQTPPPLSSTDLLALKHSPTDYIPEAPHNTPLSLSLSPFRTPQTSRKVVLKKTFCPAPTSSNSSNKKPSRFSRWRPASSRERRWVGGAWKQARLGKRRSIGTFRVGDWVREKERKKERKDGWMVYRSAPSKISLLTP